MTLAELNARDRDAFVAALGWIFEDSTSFSRRASPSSWRCCVRIPISAHAAASATRQPASSGELASIAWAGRKMRACSVSTTNIAAASAFRFCLP